MTRRPMWKTLKKTVLAAAALALTAGSIPSATAALLVTEPFNYTARAYPAGNWSGLSGSGIGWGSNVYFDHTGNACNFVIGGGGPFGTYFESQGQNYFGNYWRERDMSPAIGNSTDGTVIWQSMLMWSDGSNNGGGIDVNDSNGGTAHSVRLGTGCVYQLYGGQNNTQGTTDQDFSTIKASTNASKPDFLLFKIQNTTGPGMQAVAMWINPDVTLGEAGLPAPDLSVSYRAFIDNRNVGEINLSPGAVKMDEILFGETYRDVVSQVPPVVPYNPVPADGATDVAVSKTLSWGNADADSYQVYFWESSQSKPATPTATVTNEVYDPPGNLALDTAYSWQVIVVKGGVSAAGPQWTFRTGDPLPPGAPSAPVPADANTEVAISPTLSWAPAPRATSYNVYLWPTNQARPVTPTANVPTESYGPPAPLAYGRVYGWQVEAINEYGTNTSAPTWQFTTELLVNTPAPAGGSTNMLAWLPLAWAVAPGAAGFDVYLWKNGATKPTIPTGSVTTNRCFPYTYLDFGAAYRWQVVARLSGGGTVTGPEWSFTTQTQGQTVATPAWDISPAAQAQRAAIYTKAGRALLSGTGTPLTTGMKIDFFGDSITWLNGYVSYIQTALNTGAGTSGRSITCINRGINGGGVLQVRDGSTNNAYPSNAAQAPFASVIASDHANVAVVFIGINDVWWIGTTTNTFDQALRDIVASGNSAGVTVVLATLAVDGERPDGSNGIDPAIDQFAQITRNVAASTGKALVDLRRDYIAFLQNTNYVLSADGTISIPYNYGILTYDGIHPTTPLGNNMLADLISLGIYQGLRAPDAPAGPVPASGATGVPVGTALDWGDILGASGYQVYLWPSGGTKPATPTTNVETSAYSPPLPLTSGSTYNWQVIATNAYGPTTGAVWTFTTAAPVPPAFPPSAFSRPNGVPTFAISNSVSSAAYTLFCKTNLTDPAWIALGGTGTGTGNGGTLILTDTNPPSAHRFYRLGRNP